MIIVNVSCFDKGAFYWLINMKHQVDIEHKEQTPGLCTTRIHATDTNTHTQRNMSVKSKALQDQIYGKQMKNKEKDKRTSPKQSSKE